MWGDMSRTSWIKEHKEKKEERKRRRRRRRRVLRKAVIGRKERIGE